MIGIPEGPQQIIHMLEGRGHEAYVVGGCVRDSLLGRTPHDWDICTSALPQETIACFSGFRVIETGIQHGTVTVLFEGEPYEITTYRTDGTYSDHRRPDHVEFVRSLRQDLERRDFTVNAMAYHPQKGLVDYFSGQADLINKQIRCVGDPDRRFQEDALRILRALRFASVYEFQLEGTTARSASSNRELLRSIAGERVQEELCRLFCGYKADVMLTRFTDIFSVFLPEIGELVSFLKNGVGWPDLWGQTVRGISNAPPDRLLRLVMLLRDIGKPFCFTEIRRGSMRFYGHAGISAELAEHALRRLKFDRATISKVGELVGLHEIKLIPSDRCVLRQLSRIGEAQFRRLLVVKRADLAALENAKRDEAMRELSGVEKCLERVLAQKRCFCLKDLAIGGRDLTMGGMPQGVQIGNALRTLLQLVIDGKLENTRDSLLAHCLKEGWFGHEYKQTERHADRNGNQRNYPSECESDGRKRDHYCQHRPNPDR